MRRVVGEFAARFRESLVHLAQDVGAAALGLVEGRLHDLTGNPGNLDVHLQRGDAVFGAGNLEVHVAEMILVTQDVGQDGDAVIILDQAHGNTGNRTGDRHACIHHGQGATTHGCH